MIIFVKLKNIRKTQEKIHTTEERILTKKTIRLPKPDIIFLKYSNLWFFMKSQFFLDFATFLIELIITDTACLIS